CYKRPARLRTDVYSSTYLLLCHRSIIYVGDSLDGRLFGDVKSRFCTSDIIIITLFSNFNYLDYYYFNFVLFKIHKHFTPVNQKCKLTNI
ncbi:hypothetical protein VIGAN_01348900, partial [Vigna angularis var. angularis]